MTQPLDLDILRSSFQFLDRQQLWTLSAGSNQRIHSLIDTEYGNTAPYLIFEKLVYQNNDWIYKPNEESNFESLPNESQFFAFLSAHKFIRFRVTSILSHDNVSIDFLRSINHLWIGQELSLQCFQIRPSPELYQLISTSAGKLILEFPEAFSVLSELFIQNDRYYSIILRHETVYSPFPYVDNIIEFLFSSDVNTRKELCMFSRGSPPSIQHRTQISNAVKQKFISAAVVLNFDYNFEWLGCGAQWMKKYEVFQNSETNQRMMYQISAMSFSLKTLAIGADIDVHY